MVKALLITFCTGVFFIVAACDNGPVSISDDLHVLDRGLSVEPESLDPHRFSSNSSAEVLRDTGEGLLSYAADGRLIGGAAASWTVSDDRLVYEFKLRNSSVWSTGEPVIAEDFVFAFRRLLDPKTGSPYAGALSMIKNAEEISNNNAGIENLGVHAIDDSTLRIALKSPTPYFAQLLTHPSTYPIHRPSFQEFGDEFSRPGNYVSNGPYVLEDRIIGSTISLIANLPYWGAEEPGFGRIVYHTVEEAAEVNLFRSGDLEITANIDGAMFASMMAERPNEVRVSPYLGVFYYGFNLESDVFANSPEVRRALSMAVDRKSLVEAVLGRGEKPAYAWVPPGINGYASLQLDYASLEQSAREEQARALYSSAGYTQVDPLKFELRYNTSGVQTRIALALQAMWRDVLGAEVTLVNEEFGVLLSNIEAMEVTEMFRLSWTGDYNDPLTFLQLFLSDDPSNLTGFSNENYDALLAAAAAETDPVERMRMLGDAEHIALLEHPVIPLYFYVSKHLVAESVSGWTDNVLDIHPSKFLSPESVKQ